MDTHAVEQVELDADVVTLTTADDGPVGEFNRLRVNRTVVRALVRHADP